MANAYDFMFLEAEARRLQVWDQAGKLTEIVCQNKKDKKAWEYSSVVDLL